MWAKQTSDARGPSKKRREKEEKKRGGLMTTPFFFPPLFDECILVYVVTNLARNDCERKTRPTTRHAKKARTPEERIIVSRENRISASARARGRSRGRSRGRGTARARRRLCEIYTIERERHARWLTWQQRGKKRHFESNRRKTRAGKMDNRGYARSFFARRDRARARGKSRRAGSRRARDGYRAARPMRTRFRSRAKERHFFWGGWQRVR